MQAKDDVESPIIIVCHCLASSTSTLPQLKAAQRQKQEEAVVRANEDGQTKVRQWLNSVNPFLLLVLGESSSRSRTLAC